MLGELGIPDSIRVPFENILALVIIFVVGMVLMKIILHIVRRTLEKSSLDVVLYRFIIKIVKTVLWILLILTIMERLGLKVSSILTVLAAAGAAIALALRDSLANVAGGIMIMINKPFVQDDYVDINGNMGKVKDIDLFVTHLHTYDNKVITIPNGVINTSILINHTKENKRRVDCSFSIGYDDDIKRVKEILAEIAASSPLIVNDPKPLIGVAAHQDNCICMDFFVWCNTDDYWNVKYYVQEEVKLAFDREGITIPYPQMDVHIADNNSK